MLNNPNSTLNLGQAKCPHCGLIGSSSIHWMNDHWENCSEHPKRNLSSFQDVLKFIQNNKDDYGIGLDGKKYCLVFCWGDGLLYLLERNDEESDHQKDIDRYDEKRNQWPENHYDGDQLWYTRIGRGEEAQNIADLLDYMEVEYLG